MRYTIITPTICRESLLRLCDSIDSQSSKDWEHLVVVDAPWRRVSSEQRRILQSLKPRDNRRYLYCERKHKNYGHTCRHQAWEHAKGDYIMYVDDDDRLADNDVLNSLDCVVAPWAVFPVLRHGRIFFGLPPGLYQTGTGMFIHKKEIGRWPDSNAYEADGRFVEELKNQYRYEVVDSRPLVIQPLSSYGILNAQTWLGDKRLKLARRWVEYLNQAKTH